MYQHFIGRNGNVLYRKALIETLEQGEDVAPRGKATKEIQALTTVLEPLERVLTVPGRAANPFFNVAENLAIVAGLQNQRDWFKQFNKQYLEVAHDSPSDEASWAFYGTRLRKWPIAFIFNGDTVYQNPLDQLRVITRKLEEDPFTRQAVATLWHPYLDNTSGHKDYPCNWGVMFKIRKGHLEMTVINRSNDIHWGLYGVNLSQWSFIQETLAAILEVSVGHQIHVSDSLHVYLDEPHATITKNIIESGEWFRIQGLYPGTFDVYDYTFATPMFRSAQSWELIDQALKEFFEQWYSGVESTTAHQYGWVFLRDAWYFLKSYIHRKDLEQAMANLAMVEDNALFLAGVEYLLRKETNRGGIHGEIKKRFGGHTEKIEHYIVNANPQSVTVR